MNVGAEYDAIVEFESGSDIGFELLELNRDLSETDLESSPQVLVLSGTESSFDRAKAHPENWDQYWPPLKTPYFEWIFSAG